MVGVMVGMVVVVVRSRDVAIMTVGTGGIVELLLNSTFQSSSMGSQYPRAVCSNIAQRPPRDSKTAPSTRLPMIRCRHSHGKFQLQANSCFPARIA